MERDKPFRDADQASYCWCGLLCCPPHTRCLFGGKNLQQRRHLETLEQDCRKIPSRFELEGMLYYSTLVKLELIRQVSFKCNNVKEIQTIISLTRQGKKYSSFSVFVLSMCSVLGCASAGSWQVDAATPALSG